MVFLSLITCYKSCISVDAFGVFLVTEKNKLTIEVRDAIESDFESLKQALLTESNASDFYAIECTRH